MNSSKEWKVTSSEKIIDHPYISLSMQNIELPDGRQIKDWPMVHPLDFANALVLNAAGEALVLEGYKHGLGKSTWQVLGGYLEPGERPLEAIQRELLEETGCVAEEWQELGSFVVDANRHMGNGYFFIAKNARVIAEPAHDDLEDFEIHWVSLEDLESALFEGRFGVMTYGINIALALLALRRTS